MADPSLGERPAVDAAQAGVIEAPVAARLLVTAGPGTGKTRTLLARATRLVDVEELEPALDLLLLSFSRAAVETVARRGFTETDLGRLPVSTIDSLASRILLETGVDAGKGFDTRIAQATEVITENPPGLSGFLGHRHVLIDEAQDIVGVRAGFILKLLEYVCADEGAGFTVFGDAAQAIFDFQVVREAPVARLLDLLPESPLGTESAELTTNYRMRNQRLVDLAARFGPLLRKGGSEEPWGDLRDELAEEIRLESGWLRLDQAAAEVRAVVEAPGEPTVAVLTRTNVEALRVASRLQAAGLDVVLRHRVQDRGGAGWLAALFGGEEFTDVQVPAAAENGDLASWFRPPAETGRVLSEAGVVSAGRVDLRRLAALLRAGACPEALVAQRQAPVTVSTIHQAKGLEFDIVFVVENEFSGGNEDSAEAIRVLYVAATRPRDELLSGAALEAQGPLLAVDGGDRVGVGYWRGHGAQYVEVKVSDSDSEWAPADRDEFDRVQARLAAHVAPGDRADLRRAEAGSDGEPLYTIVHRDTDGDEAIVGLTSAGFGAMLSRVTRGRPPEAITGLAVDVPDTGVLASAQARRLGLGEHGLHLRVRVYGLAWVGQR